MGDKLTWLHISDLHARLRDKWDSDRVTSGLISDLKKSDADGLRPDLIFFTGDAAYGSIGGEKIQDQFAEVAKFLDAVRKAFTPEIPKDRLFLVPGNHDIERAAITEGETQWLRAHERTPEEIVSAMRDNTRQWSFWMERLKPYRDFLKSYGLDHLTVDDPHLIWANTLEISGKKIGIIGFNSAWSCANNDDKGKLWLGGKWQAATLESRLSDCSFKIALIHHPSNWFNGREDPNILRLFRRNFEIVLHGHEHQDFVDADPKDHFIVSAGACFQGSEIPNAYNFGQIDFAQRSGKIFLRGWEDGGGGWTKKIIADYAPDGVWEIPTLKWLPNLSAATASHRLEMEIVDIAGITDPKKLKQKLTAIVRCQLPFEPQYAEVRTTEQQRFKNILSKNRHVWLAADWQMGKTGFIAACLNITESAEDLGDIFRLDCSLCDSPEQILDASDTQLGIAFGELAELTRICPNPILILDDIPTRIASSSAYIQEINSKIRAVLDFNPKIQIICTTRLWPEHINSDLAVILQALDLPETQLYIANHPKSLASLKNSRLTDRIYTHTGGLPVAIDKLIRQNRDLSINDILNSDELSATPISSEPVFKSLISDVDHFANSLLDDDVRSYSLLKALTVLKDGETLKSIKRIYSAKPFYPKHVTLLADKGLIESIPIVHTANALTPARSVVRSAFTDNERILRVPRQVRDHVVTRITEEERLAIYNAASDVYFGKSWRRGKINWRKSLFNAYQQNSITPPGNELLITQHLLRSAIENKRMGRLEIIANLAVGYCSKLDEADRFRDLALAAGSIADMLDQDQHTKYWITAAYFLGKSLRMQLNYGEAIDILKRVLERATGEPNSFKTSILLNLALAYKGNDENSESSACCNQILSLEDKDSGPFLHAKSIIAQIKLTGHQLEAELKTLYSKAVRRKYNVCAQNIALELAKAGKSTKESIYYLDYAIIASQNNPYGLTRAITQKTELLLRDGKISDLKNTERAILCSAYAYSYSQRMENMLESCHEALWEICTTLTLWAPLLRLFRYSSFIWRLNGNLDRELTYLKKASNLPDLKNPEYLEIEMEITYLENRISDRHLEDGSNP